MKVLAYIVAWICWSCVGTLLAIEKNAVYAQFWSQENRCKRTLFDTPEGKLERIISSGLGAVRFSTSQTLLKNNYFVGRVFDRTSGRWGLTLAQYEEEKGRIDTLYSVVDPTKQRVEIKGLAISQAYDPEVVDFEGETWVAFECTGIGDVLGFPGICMGPLELKKGVYKLNRERTRPVVVGTRKPYKSASVPKLLVHKGKLYLYWTVVQKKDVGGFESLTSRGVRLLQTKDRAMAADFAVHWPSNRTYIETTDERTYAVWESDKEKDGPLLDIFDVVSDGEAIYATAAVGKCVYPLEEVNGCYRLTVSRSLHPLGYHIFNNDQVEARDLPSMSQNYASFLTLPNGNAAMMIQFLDVKERRDQDSFHVPSGLYLYQFQEQENIKDIQSFWLEDFAKAIFNDLVGRDPEQSELEDLVRLDRDVAPTPEGMITTLLSKKIVKDVMLQKVYQMVLNRLVDDQGALTWGKFFSKKGFLETVKRVAVSTESKNMAIRSYSSSQLKKENFIKEQFIRWSYERLLKRVPSLDEIEKMRVHPEKKIVKMILLSDEYRVPLMQKRRCSP